MYVHCNPFNDHCHSVVTYSNNMCDQIKQTLCMMFVCTYQGIIVASLRVCSIFNVIHSLRCKMYYIDTLANFDVVTVLSFYCSHCSILGTHKIQSTCSASIYQDKTTSKSSASGGFTTVPVSTHHNDPSKKL